MAIGTPFHPRVEPLCQSYDWTHWSGYLVANSYSDFVQPEYAAIRNSAALIDVSPLYKYEVSGRDAALLMDRLITQHADAMVVGQVVYTPWLDADGKVRQEGTVFRLAEDTFMVAAAEPAFHWIHGNGRGYDVTLRDRSSELAALSLQGPHSGAILNELCGERISRLAFFHATQAQLAGSEVMVSRTGYTGDLGYEIWIDAQDALTVWDALVEVGRQWHIMPCGLTAMDIARVEAGFVLIGVDYVSCEFAHIDEDKVSPYEIGLGWAVKLDKGNFVGRNALLHQREQGEPPRRMVGLEIDWQPLEDLFMTRDLMPELPMTVRREPVPVYSGGIQVGRASSRVWSKLLKKYVALATIRTSAATVGAELEMEVTVQYERCRVPAKVVKRAFFRPQRMRA